MNWNPEDIVPGHLLTVIILACVVGALLITLLVIVIIKLRKRKFASYRPIQELLYQTKFKYVISYKDSDKNHYFIKVTYYFLDCFITYCIYVPKRNDYLTLAKKTIKNDIANYKLCGYTIKILKSQGMKQYATC